MVFSVSVTLANLVTDVWDSVPSGMCQPTQVQFWKVASATSAWHSCQAKPLAFHNHLNPIDPSIQFNIECEENGEPPFPYMEVTITQVVSIQKKL